VSSRSRLCEDRIYQVSFLLGLGSLITAIIPTQKGTCLRVPTAESARAIGGSGVRGTDIAVVTSAIPFAAADVAALKLARRIRSLDLLSTVAESNAVNSRIRRLRSSRMRRAWSRTYRFDVVTQRPERLSWFRLRASA